MSYEIAIKRLRIYKVIYGVVALLLILFNIAMVLPYYSLGVFFDGYSSWSQKLGHFLSRHLLIVFALFLFIRVYFINRKIKELLRESIFDEIDEIGEEN